MRKLFISIIISLFAFGTGAWAIDLGADASASAKSKSFQKQGQQQQQQVNFGIPDSLSISTNDEDARNTQNIRQNPNVVTPDLITSHSQDLCLGSASAGGAGGGVGLSFGKTYLDETCVRRRDATLLYNMGLKDAAKERLCDSIRMYAAFKRVGQPCYQRGNFERELAKAANPEGEN